MKIVFLGTPDFAVPTLERLRSAGHEIVLVISQPDREAGRGRKVRPTPVKRKAADLGLAVDQPEDVNSPLMLSKIESLRPDVIVVAAFGQYLKKKLRDLAPHGCINLHSSLLPKLRGAAPIQRAIIDGFDVTGVTTMKIAQKMDAGDMLLSTRVEIAPKMTAGELHDLLASAGADLMAETLEKLANGNINTIVQDNDKATYAPKIEPRERKIDWTQSAIAIDRKVRGFSPVPGACTFFGNKRLTLMRSLVGKDGPAAEAEPATILGVEADHLVVQTGNGTLCVHEIKQEGKSTMNAAAWARGARVSAGQKFFDYPL
ncbi:MAG: methionyl-tRNA formyltransferase [bacterium]|nr:MAG: methionyl-tRNA formyltransferase [bacterium]